jgi:hypothetical protein
MGRGEIYTGKILEADVLGVPRGAELFESKPEYIRYKDAVTLIHQIQPERPTYFMAELRDRIEYIIQDSDELLSSHEEAAQLLKDATVEMYTAVGTSLDYHHGIDGFAELTCPQCEEPYRVTLDVTGNPEKTYSKSDIIVYVGKDDMDLEDHKSLFLNLVDKTADAITNHLIKVIEIKSASRRRQV